MSLQNLIVIQTDKECLKGMHVPKLFVQDEFELKRLANIKAKQLANAAILENDRLERHRFILAWREQGEFQMECVKNSMCKLVQQIKPYEIKKMLLLEFIKVIQEVNKFLHTMYPFSVCVIHFLRPNTRWSHNKSKTIFLK